MKISSRHSLTSSHRAPRPC